MNHADENICIVSTFLRQLGEGYGSVVKASDSWSKGGGFESRQERLENVLLQYQLSVLTLILYPLHPRISAVAHKRSRPFCRWCIKISTKKITRVFQGKWCTLWLYTEDRLPEPSSFLIKNKTYLSFLRNFNSNKNGLSVGEVWETATGGFCFVWVCGCKGVVG